MMVCCDIKSNQVDTKFVQCTRSISVSLGSGSTGNTGPLLAVCPLRNDKIHLTRVADIKDEVAELYRDPGKVYVMVVDCDTKC